MDTLNTGSSNKNDLKQEKNEPVGATSSMSIIDLTAIINRYVLDIDKVKGTMKEKSLMFKDAFENDAEYHEQNIKVKDLSKLKNAAKQRILKQPAMEALTAQINDLKLELKDMQDMLSGYLEQYQKTSGTNIIETENGVIREIIPVFKLVKRKI
ncbi:hypothetical protein A3K21_01595 [Candidatus Roizmanbacteria bacterium RIFOXYC1_FULL_38_14]|uniref:Uncharacterized protein n=1 Tax=Candidatus Roizmanbacteria bacterium RIFOXYD1_FULL_38_12 TaxID=1802093 RepID=A0A1F7L012_9BACT|nr:MAG: hypothetical protein A3K47_01590 [Candidatus Roizmanbacteria bacterium RIFOXYA2_FULL_38_14]OGK63477.1 MAG: hypothetical protein A3K27_01590 [Candidatus Roizmanbacteria bacterium RIFOXYA1_FULL_37_12]OGK65323.1 MAG: hypothetical protein A3K38_01590 [Candidatus Roizmanbacteria bacterium RIFOXYB1_FULL_40_23]OGK69728.1 MAG: hypothetical protein A3K21_01595 [Candidatus Roizmanbacteria bacterium RIFOXYC1_FULL_38_14]OGK73470.1 MAG: hypothetical protein A3K52_01590 [Candidatus Roizmanbacteria ba